MPGRNALAAVLIGALLSALSEFGAGGFAAFMERFQAVDALRGQDLLLQNGRQTLRGQGQGIDATGRLAVRLIDGTLAHFAVGEVRIAGANR